ncbi:MAG: tetratricopeptide repeat protein [Deltaproteobacteria bacterium]|nr:MAG: tetratricopeptide repeat protein [Deltaproteobacteria bacterium]
MGPGTCLRIREFSMASIRRNLFRQWGWGSDVSVCILLTAINLIIFGNVLYFDFVFDDTYYLTGDAHIKDGLSTKNILWAFTAIDGGFYFPITWLSLLLDYELYGYFPGGYHWTNLLIHISSTLILFFTLKHATGTILRSGLVSALFAVHPLHIESVAWIAERKDVLSAFFWMLTMETYVSYTKKPFLKRYLLVVLCFTLGLMSKAMLVTLPFVMLLLDYWPLKRVSFFSERDFGQKFHLIWEKMPLIILSMIFCVITIYAQQKAGAMMTLENIPMDIRAINATVSYFEYMKKMFWPIELAVFYPYIHQHGLYRVALAGFVLLGICTFVAMQWRKRPYLAVGWLWYLGTLIPVIGIVQVGGQSMADRYTYIPLIGLFIMIIWGGADFFKAGSGAKPFPIGLRQGIVMAGVVIIIALMFCSWFQVQYWKDSYALFTRALNVTKDNYLAHGNLGVAFKDSGDFKNALFHFQEAVRIKPNYTIGYDNLGCVYILMGRPAESIPYLRKALEISPGYRRAKINLACALVLDKQYGESIALYEKLVMLEPDDPELYNSFGVALAGQGRVEEAMRCFEWALKKDPNYIQAHRNKYLVGKQMKK